MSHLLRHPAAVPALFSPGVENERQPGRHRPPAARHLLDGATLLVCPALVLMAQGPLTLGAAELLRLALAH